MSAQKIITSVFKFLLSLLIVLFIWLFAILLFTISSAVILGVFLSENISDWNYIPFVLLSILILFFSFYPGFYVFPSKKIWQRTLTGVVTIILFLSPVFSIGYKTLSIAGAGEFEKPVEGHIFSLFEWEVQEFSIKLADVLIFWNGSIDHMTDAEQSELVLSYIVSAQIELELTKKELEQGLSEDEKQTLGLLRKQIRQQELQAGNILARQLEEVYRNEGIINPWDKTGIFFPPVSFKITKPPKILVITYRDRLEEKKRIFLDPDISIEEMEKIEKNVDSMGYSSLVAGLGGVGTYPSIILARSPQRTIEIIAHEWIHNYIRFTPLGGIKATTEQRVIEETTASIVDREIAEKVWEKFYVPYVENKKNSSITFVFSDLRASEGINFDESMREIRLQVEEYLEAGRVEEAENYMSKKRDWLEEEGHYVRKLNQAYLTFRGFYATSVAYKDANKGIGAKLLELRDSVGSLKEFLSIATNIKNLQELDKELSSLNKK